jgi:hypothetical protein
MTDKEGVQLPRSEILKFLLPGLNALFGSHYAMSEPFELTIREYATRSGNDHVCEYAADWFGSTQADRARSSSAMPPLSVAIESKWEQGETTHDST